MFLEQPKGQIAEIALISLRTKSFMPYIYKRVYRTAIGIIDKYKFHISGISKQIRENIIKKKAIAILNIDVY